MNCSWIGHQQFVCSKGDRLNLKFSLDLSHLFLPGFRLLASAHPSLSFRQTKREPLEPTRLSDKAQTLAPPRSGLSRHKPGSCHSLHPTSPVLTLRRACPHSPPSSCTRLRRWTCWAWGLPHWGADPSPPWSSLGLASNWI